MKKCFTVLEIAQTGSNEDGDFNETIRVAGSIYLSDMAALSAIALKYAPSAKTALETSGWEKVKMSIIDDSISVYGIYYDFSVCPKIQRYRNIRFKICETEAEG